MGFVLYYLLTDQFLCFVKLRKIFQKHLSQTRSHFYVFKDGSGSNS